MKSFCVLALEALKSSALQLYTFTFWDSRLVVEVVSLENLKRMRAKS